jgi:hypothetical protein
MKKNMSLANSESETYGKRWLGHSLWQKYSGTLLEKLRKLLPTESVCKVKFQPRKGHDVPEGK